MAESIPQRWAEQARYDLDTARAMLDSERYLYVLFCCQQAVEKILKAVIAERTGECPPRLHNLMKLAEHAQIDLDQAQEMFMRELSRYYVETRYPDQIAELSRGMRGEKVAPVLDQTEEMLRWLSSML